MSLRFWGPNLNLLSFVLVFHCKILIPSSSNFSSWGFANVSNRIMTFIDRQVESDWNWLVYKYWRITVNYLTTYFFLDLPIPSSVTWYCAVKRFGGIQAAVLDVASAQAALGVGSLNSIQAIIPMIDGTAGDPHDLPKSWSGGSMWWGSWGDINAMRDICTADGMLFIDVPNALGESHGHWPGPFFPFVL